MHFVNEAKFLEAYFACADHVVTHGRRKSDMNEVQDLACLISPNFDEWLKFQEFVENISEKPELRYGAEKAKRAYERLSGNITKPSYIGRLKEFPFLKTGTNDFTPIDQIALVIEKFGEAPQSSNLSMSIFHPSDLRDAFRPGYVPCLSFVDIKFRNGELRTKFFFRSCDFAEVALFDFFHCAKIHYLLNDHFREQRPDVSIVDSKILFFFSRAFTYKRKRKPIEFIKSYVASD